MPTSPEVSNNLEALRQKRGLPASSLAAEFQYAERGGVYSDRSVPYRRFDHEHGNDVEAGSVRTEDALVNPKNRE
jgi:hypothetical protein